MYKALLDKVSRGRNLPPVWAAFFMAGENPGEMEAICSSFLPLLILCRPLLWLSALAWACGALSISWRDTAAIIPVPMLMCRKVTHKNLIDRSPLFHIASLLHLFTLLRLSCIMKKREKSYATHGCNYPLRKRNRILVVCYRQKAYADSERRNTE